LRCCLQRALLIDSIDVAKIRIQVQGSLGIHKYSGGTFSIIRNIYREEGIPGVFRGVGPALFTIPLFWGVYWPIYDRMKVFYKDNYPDIKPHTAHLGCCTFCPLFSSVFIVFSEGCAITAGVVSDVITNPFWVTRTRIQTLALHSEVHLALNITTVDMMKLIYREEGIIAFYRGLGASLLGLSHVAIQFPLCKVFLLLNSHFLLVVALFCLYFR
jgi:solute carrier family 25 folate transporter 32